MRGIELAQRHQPFEDPVPKGGMTVSPTLTDNHTPSPTPSSSRRAAPPPHLILLSDIATSISTSLPLQIPTCPAAVPWPLSTTEPTLDYQQSASSAYRLHPTTTNKHGRRHPSQ